MALGIVAVGLWGGKRARGRLEKVVQKLSSSGEGLKFKENVWPDFAGEDRNRADEARKGDDSILIIIWD